MQSSYWGYWLVLMGVAIVGLMISVNGLTTTSTQDHYAVQEIVEASMLESIDYGYYRDYNEVKMNKEKFMEVFTRMLAESMTSTDTYEINFYEMYEAPPKVSVEVKSHSGTNFISTSDYDVTTRVDAIVQIHAEEVGNSNSSNNSNNSNNNNSYSNNNSSSNNSVQTGNNNVVDSPIASETCKSGITTTELKGMHGVAMSSKSIYETSELKNSTKSAIPGIKFEILGESGDYWAINYDNECGWVDSKYMAINLQDYIPSITYSISNASGSIFKTYDGNGVVNIGGLTGKKLYTNEFNGFTPATFSFAKKLKIAQNNAQRNGDSLKIYEAYRPTGVSKYATTQLENLRRTNSGVKYNTNYSIGANTGKEYYWDSSWFLAKNVSKHNTGCAVDVTLVGKENQMPSGMHQLSTQAIKYYSPSVSHTAKNYSGGMQKSTAAQNLSNYMMSGTGLTDLASEWWHYQDDVCHSTIGSGANFWSAV